MADSTPPPSMDWPLPPASLARQFPPASCPVSGCGPLTSGQWLRLCIGGLIAAQSMTLGLAISVTPPDDPQTTAILHGGLLVSTLMVFALLGGPLLAESGRHWAAGRLTVEPLFLSGIAAAMGLSCRSVATGAGPVYFEVVCILLVVHGLGRAANALTARAVQSAAEALAPPEATARRADHHVCRVGDLAVGDEVLVRPGEAIPVDGQVIAGRSLVSGSLFRGEIHPALAEVAQPGATVQAGQVALDGSLTVRANTPGRQRRIDRLAQLIDTAAARPVSLYRQADRWVAWFLPAVMAVATGTFVYWYALADQHGLTPALFNTLAVLLVACPCAAGLATPLAVWSVLLACARQGLILRGGGVVERLARAEVIVFDKTGTLADERLTLVSFTVAHPATDSALATAVVRAIEQHSNHPVARVLANLPAPDDAPTVVVERVTVCSGYGVTAELLIDGQPHQAALMRVDPAAGDLSAIGRLVIALTLDGQLAARATFTEHLRPTAQAAIEQLAQLGLTVRVMTGDGPTAAKAVVQSLAPQAILSAGLSAEAKLAAVKALVGDRNAPTDKPAPSRWPTSPVLVFVGDGLNDAAAMSASHLGIALAHGDALTVDGADATLHHGHLTAVPQAIAWSRAAVAAIAGSLRWATLYNLTGMALAATGSLHPVAAALLMAGSSAWVAWRAFAVSQTAMPDPPLQPLPPNGANPPGWFDLTDLAHRFGLWGQVAVLTALADLSASTTALALLATVVLTEGVIALRRRLPPVADMTVAMIAIGGLGMTLGWWIDVGFAPAFSDGHLLCCHGLAATAGFALGPWASPAMYSGMILLGVPAMYTLTRYKRPFDWRSPCCFWPLALGVPGMVIGMALAAAGAAAVLGHATPLTLNAQVVAVHLAMTAGMTAGMTVGHIPPWLTPSASPFPRALPS